MQNELMTEIAQRLEAILSKKSIQRDMNLEELFRKEFGVDIPLTHSTRCTLVALKTVIDHFSVGRQAQLEQAARDYMTTIGGQYGSSFDESERAAEKRLGDALSGDL